MFDQNSRDINRLDKILQARNQWFKDDSDNKNRKADAERELRERNGP